VIARAFEAALARSEVREGTRLCVLHEAQGRERHAQAALDAALRLGAEAFRLALPASAPSVIAPLTSTGASVSIAGQSAVIAALSACEVIVDCTQEGLMHAPELPQILGAGARVIYASAEPDEVLARLLPNAALEEETKSHIKRMRSARSMRVRSAAGTSLEISLEGAAIGGNWGSTARAGTLTHWPGGLVLAFPKAGALNGRLVFAPGDANLGFKRYFESAVVCTVESDVMTRIEGSGADAALMRGYLERFAAAEGSRDCFAVSHIGYGTNRSACFESMSLYDKSECNGTELRVAAGSFLYSTGINDQAGRKTEGHFDLPMTAIDVWLDDAQVIENGVLC
jgi:2,5-dihydroxypyridine 5,6-dioxygenase